MYFAKSYGIFSGNATQEARLKFDRNTLGRSAEKLGIDNRLEPLIKKVIPFLNLVRIKIPSWSCISSNMVPAWKFWLQ
jgi:hypothetical protein